MKSILLVCLFTYSLFAHKLNLFISNENNTLIIYSYFANSAPCKNCNLIIKNHKKTILQDKLDANGKYTYIPKDKNMEIIVDASGGHIVKETLVIPTVEQRDFEEYKDNEKALEYKKIILGLTILFIFFLLFKRLKSE